MRTNIQDEGAEDYAASTTGFVEGNNSGRRVLQRLSTPGQRKACAAPSVRPSTLKGYRHYVEKNIRPYLGDKQICKVATADVQSLYRELQKEGGANGGPLAGR